MIDPKKIRPTDGWCVVLMDPVLRKVGAIFAPPTETSAEKLTEGVGTVIRIGKGPKNDALGLKKGSRVAMRSYLKYAMPLETDERWPPEPPLLIGDIKSYFIMSTHDLMGEVGKDVNVGVYSRPAMSSVPEGAFDEQEK